MRLIVESGNVRGSKCKPRSYVPEMKTQGHGYRADLELRDRSRGDLRVGYPLEIALGVVEPARARYTDVIHDMD